MAGWREKKQKAKDTIHQTFEIPAVYLTHAAGEPQRVNVRLHLKQLVQQVQVDDWSNAGSMLDASDRIIFKLTDCFERVLNQSFVIFSRTEAYRTGPSEPARSGYVQTEVSAVPAAELEALLDQINTGDYAFEGILC